MNRFATSSLLALLALTTASIAPASAETPRKTELVGIDGQSVDNIQLRHGFNAVWVVDTKNLLWRDDSRDHYLITLAKDCEQLARRRPFSFHPAESWELDSARSYQIRPLAGERCDVAKIAQVDDGKAATLRASALRRAW